MTDFPARRERWTRRHRQHAKARALPSTSYAQVATLRSSRAVVVDPLARSMHDLAFAISQNDELLKIVTKTLQDWNGATETDRARAVSFLLGYFKLFENAWFQMHKETLEREQWGGYDAFMRTIWTLPSVKNWWQMRRTFFAPRFRQYVEQCEASPA